MNVLYFTVVGAYTKEETVYQISSIDGTAIGFKRSGAGPALLLVHGATADHRRWSAISNKFEKHFTVYAMDRRGRGGSGDSPDYDLQREAEDVAAVVNSIGEPVNVLGHSYGGLCSLEAALLTDKINRLILYEPAGSGGADHYAQNTIDRMQELIDSGENEAAVEMMFREIVKMPEHELIAYRKLPMWKGRILLAPTLPRELAIDLSYRFDAHRFRDQRAPTLLLLGGDSPAFVKEATERVNSALPNSKIMILTGQQHIAMDTNPDLFVREVLRFLLA
jgi:pimeloyl-ACP methyl ester carboxylesterase